MPSRRGQPVIVYGDFAGRRAGSDAGPPTDRQVWRRGHDHPRLLGGDRRLPERLHQHPRCRREPSRAAETLRAGCMPRSGGRGKELRAGEACSTVFHAPCEGPRTGAVAGYFPAPRGARPRPDRSRSSPTSPSAQADLRRSPAGDVVTLEPGATSHGHRGHPHRAQLPDHRPGYERLSNQHDCPRLNRPAGRGSRVALYSPSRRVTLPILFSGPQAKEGSVTFYQN